MNSISYCNKGKCITAKGEIARVLGLALTAALVSYTIYQVSKAVKLIQG